MSELIFLKTVVPEDLYTFPVRECTEIPEKFRNVHANDTNEISFFKTLQLNIIQNFFSHLSTMEIILTKVGHTQKLLES